MRSLKNYLNFIEINKKNINHINFLFERLRNRKFNISHYDMPSMKEHIEFVNNNPYFKWYLVEKFNKLIGSFYIMYSNSIGIDLENKEINHFGDIIDFIKKNYKPFPPIKSVRPEKFFINVAADDHKKIKALELTNSQLVQSTYLID